MPTYQYKVEMTCGSCSKAVQNVLSKNPECKDVSVSLETQIVKVSSDKLTKEQVFEVIKKAGKPTTMI